MPGTPRPPRDVAVNMIHEATRNLTRINGKTTSDQLIAAVSAQGLNAVAAAILDLADAVRSLDGAPGYEMGSDPE